MDMSSLPGVTQLADLYSRLRVLDGAVRLDDADSSLLTDKAYELIRFDILTFRLKPGERTSERSLAERYELGVGPIRAALPRLVQEGLIERSGERGTSVAALTLRTIRETYQMRFLLEPAAAELAATLGMDSARLDRLREVCEAEWPPQGKATVVHILLANRDFNIAIAEATGNALLVRTISHLQNLSLRILFLGSTRDNIANFWGEGPGKIRDAIVARNGPLARRLYTADLAEGERWAMQAIMGAPDLENINLTNLGAPHLP